MTNYGMPYTNGDRQPQIPASVAESLLNTEQIADLTKQAELQDIALTAEQKIKEVVAKDGYGQTIDGVALILSNGYVAGQAKDGTSVYARLYTTTESDESTRCGILFDITPDKAIVTTNLDGISVNDGSIVVGSEFNAGIEVDPKEEVYRYVEDVVDTLWKDVTEKEKLDIEKARYAKVREKQEKEWARASKKRHFRNTVKEYGIVLVPSGLLVFCIGGLTLAIVNSEELPAITDAAAAIPVGSQAAPAFSSQLYGSDAFESDSILNLPSNSFKTGEVREFELESSRPFENCEIKLFDEDSRPSLTSKVKAWTDSVNPDGTPRSDEILVTYALDEIKACWVADTERGEDDKVRVVVQMTDPAATTTEG